MVWVRVGGGEEFRAEQEQGEGSCTEKRVVEGVVREDGGGGGRGVKRGVSGGVRRGGVRSVGSSYKRCREGV